MEIILLSLMGAAWVVGCLVFIFMKPIAGMTDPPMQWGYPLTVGWIFSTRWVAASMNRPTPSNSRL